MIEKIKSPIFRKTVYGHMQKVSWLSSTFELHLKFSKSSKNRKHEDYCFSNRNRKRSLHKWAELCIDCLTKAPGFSPLEGTAHQPWCNKSCVCKQHPLIDIPPAYCSSYWRLEQIVGHCKSHKTGVAFMKTRVAWHGKFLVHCLIFIQRRQNHGFRIGYARLLDRSRNR